VSRRLVSVVLPAFNGERFLAEAIESVLAQTWSPVQLIVVDDGSTDASGEIARAYPITCLRQPNRGVAAARNRGLEAAQGELISFLDQDDLWLPRKLERQVAALESDRSAQMSMCHWEAFLEPGDELPAWANPEVLGDSNMSPQLGTLLVTRELVEEVGPFDTSYFAANDVDWFIRAQELGVRVAVVDEPLQRYRIHDDNNSAREDLLRHELLRALWTSVRRKRGGEAAAHG
jgi:glycosyltransferase involved in cell wall biosynthesis